METVETVLFGLGVVFVIIGSVWFLIESFHESIWWGLGCLLLSPVQFIFLILHWSAAKRPFGLQILGLVMILFSSLLAPSGNSLNF